MEGAATNIYNKNNGGHDDAATTIVGDIKYEHGNHNR